MSFDEKEKEKNSIAPTGDGFKQQPVSLQEMSLEEVLVQHNLHIPNYQRIYCWRDTNVNLLLNDVFSHAEKGKEYFLGTIILHHIKDSFDIIDGQQRLVTLLLLLIELGDADDYSLAHEKFEIKESESYIAYNRWLIRNFVSKIQKGGSCIDDIKSCIRNIKEKLKFGVLVLNNTSLDLAYTFFSNQNSRGVPLTDYDLLKAYHLRYIPESFPKQAETAANDWNKMIGDSVSSSGNRESPDYVRTLDICLYRMRNWMRKHDCEDDRASRRIKREFEAAPIIEEIPPFGEKFYFNEPIQGGTHFFSYVQLHLRSYQLFANTLEYKTLRKYMQGRNSHICYADVIEALLYSYFLKFNLLYLSEALMVVMRIILQHRYENGRARKESIIRYAKDSELILMLDRATSTTFFLGEAYKKVKELDMPYLPGGIRTEMKKIASKISKDLEKKLSINCFNNINS